MKEGEEVDKLEKVISSIKECNNNVPGRCDKCPYRGKDTHDCVGELLNDALELLKERQWIPVTDRLPQDDEDVLVWVNGTHRDMAYRDEGVWYDEEHNHLRNITHWMPLPKPPKGGEQG